MTLYKDIIGQNKHVMTMSILCSFFKQEHQIFLKVQTEYGASHEACVYFVILSVCLV